MSSRFAVMATSKMPEIPTDITSPVPKKNTEGSALCLAEGTAIPNKLGPVGERQGRQAPGQDLTTPTLADDRDPSSALPLKFCCPLNTPCPCGPDSSLRKTSPPPAEWEQDRDHLQTRFLTDPISRAVISLPREGKARIKHLH